MHALLFRLSVAGTLAAATASTAVAAPVYTAVPQAAPSDGQVIIHDISWRCAGGSCLAPRTGRSTDATTCSAVARGLGPLTSFAVGDAAFDASALARCNRRAR